ncbi:MAG: glutamine amidotransferase [Parvibaculum sp.]
MLTHRILIVLHQERSSPGRVGQELKRRGFALDIRRPALGDPLPATLAEHDGAIIFGGPMSANDDLDFIKAEIDWISVPLGENKPFLGICLGGQMLAKQLGAPVAPHPEKRVEIGYFPVHPTEAGQNLFDNPQFVYQWHREGFELPHGAVALACGAGDFPLQAMRYGDKAYGLQFHPELTALMMNAWLVKARHRLVEPGAQPALAQRLARHQHDRDLNGWLHRFLDHWLA